MGSNVLYAIAKIAFITAIINFLLSEREGCTGEYWQYGPSAARSYQNDRGSIFPTTARASSVSKWFIIWLFNCLLLCFCNL